MSRTKNVKKVLILIVVIAIFCSSYFGGVKAAETRKSLPYKWSSKYSTVYFYCGFNDTWKSAIGAGMSSWNGVKELSTGKNTVPMAFTANSSHSNRIYSVSGETWVGKMFPTQNNGTLTAASIAFNSGSNTFTVGAASGKYDIQTVAAHELGHAIGVAHCHEKNETPCFSSTCTTNVMRRTVPTNQTRRTLTSYDIASKQSIY